MKEFKGTKGEWVIQQDSQYPTLHGIWSKGPNTYIARTCFAPSSEANAKLIAAAPDLLEALQTVLEGDRDPSQFTILSAYDRGVIEAAIKKALG